MHAHEPTNLLHQSQHVEIDVAGSRPGFRPKKLKDGRKPARTCRKPGRPGLQLARIMECCPYQAVTVQSFYWPCGFFKAGCTAEN